MIKMYGPPNLTVAKEKAIEMEPYINKGGNQRAEGRCTTCGKWKNPGHTCKSEDIATFKKF